MTTTFIHGLLAGYGIAIPVGAIAVLIMDTGMRRGLRHGMAAGAGAATADLLYAVVAAGAGGLLVPLLAPVAAELRLLSGAILIALAVSGFASLRRARASGGMNDAREGRARGTFARFLALTLVNPLTVVYFAALVLGDGADAAGPASFLIFAAGAGIASLSWQLLLALAGRMLGATLPPRVQVLTGAVGHSVVLVFGMMMIVRGAMVV
jgi:arginine exporter protein ArgO